MCCVLLTYVLQVRVHVHMHGQIECTYVHMYTTCMVACGVAYEFGSRSLYIEAAASQQNFHSLAYLYVCIYDRAMAMALALVPCQEPEEEEISSTDLARAWEQDPAVRRRAQRLVFDSCMHIQFLCARI